MRLFKYLLLLGSDEGFNCVTLGKHGFLYVLTGPIRNCL